MARCARGRGPRRAGRGLALVVFTQAALQPSSQLQLPGVEGEALGQRLRPEDLDYFTTQSLSGAGAAPIAPAWLGCRPRCQRSAVRAKLLGILGTTLSLADVALSLLDIA